MRRFAADSVSKYFNDPNSVRPGNPRLASRRRWSATITRPNIYAINQNRRSDQDHRHCRALSGGSHFLQRSPTRSGNPLHRSRAIRPRCSVRTAGRNWRTTILDTLRSMKPAGVLLLAPLGRTSDRGRRRAVLPVTCRRCSFDSNIDGVGDVFVGSDNPQFTSLDGGVSVSAPANPPDISGDGNAPQSKRPEASDSDIWMQWRSMGHEAAHHSRRQVRGLGAGRDRSGSEGINLIDRQRATEMQTKTVLCSNDRLAIGFLAACYQKEAAGRHYQRIATCGWREWTGTPSPATPARRFDHRIP